MLTRKRDIQVRDFDDFDDLVMAVIEVELIKEGYTKLGLDAPEWLAQKLEEGKAELASRTRVQKQRKLAELKIRREGLATPDEKRSKIDAEIERLSKELT